DLRMGSFGYRGADITATLSQKKYYLNFTFSGQQARNDFVYTDLRGEDERMDNAAFSGLGFNLHGAALIGKKSQIDLFLWYQEANREIPPSITMDLSKAYQTDRALRSSIQWKTYFRKGMLNIKSAWFTEYENFTDPRISLSSKICTDIYFLESEYRHQLFRDGTLDAGISLTREEADIDAYYGHKNRDWLAAYINYKHYLPLIKWNLLAGARQEISGHTLAPFTPSFGLEGPVLSFLSHKVSLSRNYRLPTMNELYWQPGGNTDINAESSWNAEFSLISNPVPENETAEVNISATAFSSFVNDWILWLPKNNYWFADNIQKVWARGVELEAYMMLKNNYKYAKLRFSYTYSRSSNEGKDVQEGLVGKQLIYTPMHNAALRLDMGLGSWSVALYNNYTGKSYISSDNMEALPGFFISNIALNKEMNIKQVKINISARINNIFDKDYQLVAFRPMPARNFQLSILLTYKKESYD
ncbi:MAG: TonB-dependent receptor, partial [Bacteroidota bacterium]